MSTDGETPAMGQGGPSYTLDVRIQLPSRDDHPQTEARHANQIEVLQAELDWLSAAMSVRFAAYGENREVANDELPSPPSIDDASGPYAEFVRRYELDGAERLVVALALAPHVQPALLDPFLLANQATQQRFTEFGGISTKSHQGFLPTAETALFLLAGGDLARRLAFERLLGPDHRLLQGRLLILDHRHPEEPRHSAVLRLSPRAIRQLLDGADGRSEPVEDGAAIRITTVLSWDELVLDAETMEQIDLAARWVQHSPTLMNDWGLSRRLKPGYRCLFHGPAGTGKTLTAAMLGKRLQAAVYRIDLSSLMSKNIEETERNLAAQLDEAQRSNSILFFDEADMLFGGFSAGQPAANCGLAWLLDRIDAHPGLIIVATDRHGPLEPALVRRFQSVISFSIPDAEGRLRLWRDIFAEKGFTLAPDIDLKTIAENHVLTGGAIVDVLREACLKAIGRNPPTVQADDLVKAIRRVTSRDN
jgi:hypothetical protein